MKTLILFLAIIILYSCNTTEPTPDKMITFITNRYCNIELGNYLIKTDKDTTVILPEGRNCLKIGASILIGASSEWIEYNWGCADYKDYPDTIRLDTIFTDF